MKLCRFQVAPSQKRVGLVADDRTILDLTAGGVDCLTSLLESDDLVSQVNELARRDLPRHSVASVKLLAPIEQQETWAAGVTYQRSKQARMEESDFSATAYDLVYEAQRPELFFKCLAEKVVSPDEPVGIRQDARWSVPEPELALVLNSRGQLVGCTIGNDMSSRDIEGENLLYLPQAKIYHRSCSVGPWITVGVSESGARAWGIQMQILRDAQVVFAGETSVNQIRRSFAELAASLFHCQVFSQGAVLLTGTGIVPPDDFTLQSQDVVRIIITGIGTLENPVIEV
ncbi:MAG: fumarylacetoacetate hydrolase family protein [Limisphaerales bacterium]